MPAIPKIRPERYSVCRRPIFSILLVVLITSTCTAPKVKESHNNPVQVIIDSDFNRDGAVTLAESTKANGLLFGELDQDNNGFLSLSEMSAVISKSFRLEPKQIDKILAPSFHSTDLNSDGQISLTEFQKLGMKRFNKMDINRDKVITTNEMPLERLMYP